MQSSNTVIWWIRQDFRLDDNPALAWAIAHGRVIPVFIWDQDDSDKWTLGAASCWWLHHALNDLQQQISNIGGQLTIRRGNSLSVLQDLIAETHASTVVWNRLYEPASIQRDSHIKQTLENQNIAVESFNARLLIEPWIIKNQQGLPYRVFTPYWKRCVEHIHATGIITDEAPKEWPAPPTWPQGESIDSLKLLPSIAWDEDFYTQWQPQNFKPQAQLKTFIQERLSGYTENRDIPSQRGTAQLSPYLHFGQISPKQIFEQLNALDIHNADKDKFLAEIGWREFAHYLLFHFPHTATQPLDERFEKFPWRDIREPSVAADLQRWQRGETGIQLVDAGMKELWTTGWMHNRVRMIAASFLCKNLRIHWIHGAEWFWDTLVDADLASNTLGWQWVSGCGADAAPYFRVFNPDTQAQRFDPQGQYRKHWLSTPTPPIVDLKESRIQALEAWQSIRTAPKQT